MKKKHLRGQLRTRSDQLEEQRELASAFRDEARRLRAQVEEMRKGWRPVPLAHPWQPRDPQCALCDEPRDSARHTVVEDALPEDEVSG